MKPQRKQIKKEEKPFQKYVFLIVSIVTGFLFIVSFSVYYVSDAISKGQVCGCAVPVPLMLMLLSSLGVFVGSLIYYIIVAKFIKHEKKHYAEINLTLRFLEKEEKEMVQFLIKNTKPVPQSILGKVLQLDKVKVSRLIKKLEEKEIVVKKEDKKVNYITLQEDLMKVFNEN